MRSPRGRGKRFWLAFGLVSLVALALGLVTGSWVVAAAVAGVAVFALSYREIGERYGDEDSG